MVLAQAQTQQTPSTPVPTNAVSTSPNPITTTSPPTTSQPQAANTDTWWATIMALQVQEGNLREWKRLIHLVIRRPPTMPHWQQTPTL